MSGVPFLFFLQINVTDSFTAGFQTPIICHQMGAESAFDCTKYNEAE